MPLLLRVGLRRRKSLRSGAISASCELEVELPPELLSGAGATLQRRTEIVFDACREAVQTELARYETKLPAPLLKKTKQRRSKSAASRGLPKCPFVTSTFVAN